MLRLISLMAIGIRYGAEHELHLSFINLKGQLPSEQRKCTWLWLLDGPGCMVHHDPMQSVKPDHPFAKMPSRITICL
jgi:hypothetical protein